MRVDTRPYVELDGPHRPRPRRRLVLHVVGWVVLLAAMVGAVLLSMAAPLPD